MTGKSVPVQEEDPTQALRRKLAKRLAVAGVMVALLLGILALFDYLATPPEEPDVRVYTQPVPVPPKKEISQPVIASSNLPEPPVEKAPEEAPAVAQTADKPAVAAVPAEAEPVAAPPEKPPVSPAARESRPAGRLSSGRSGASVTPEAVPQPPVVRRSPPALIIEETTRSPRLAPSPRMSGEAANVLSAPPSARVVQIQPGPVAPSVSSRLFSGFVLQAGVFQSQQRAEELHAKLALSGVPSSLETRVQVGPFKSRQEAEAAQIRLRELGIETVMMPPAGARR